MGLTSAQRHNRMMDRIYANKAEYDRLAVEAAHVAALAEEAKLKVQRTLFMLCDFDVETYRKQCKAD